MAASSKAVLILTGAWHVPQHYQKLVHQLESKGIRTLCPCLPTNNNAVPPNKRLRDDVALVKAIAAEEAAKGTHLHVLAHSYGGIVATDALGEFAIKPGSEKGGVASITYMCAFIPSEGQSLAGMFGGQHPPCLICVPETETVVWTDPIHHLYNDLSEEEARRAESMRVAHPTEAQCTPIECEVAAWRVIPVNYLLCENDQAIPVFVQEAMIENVRKNNVEIKVFRCGGGHSSFISMTEKVVDVVMIVMGAD